MTSVWVGIGSIALISFMVSAIGSATWFVSARALKRLEPAAKSRALMLIVVLPIVVASLSLLAYLEWPRQEHGESHYAEQDAITNMLDTKGERTSLQLEIPGLL